MAQKILSPITENNDAADLIEAKIAKLFKDEIYLPLLRELTFSSGVVENSRSKLKQALKSGRITFYRGQFKGRFNSFTSKELKKLGATWNRKHGSWDLLASGLPSDIREEISKASISLAKKTSKASKHLAKLSPKKIADKLNIEKIVRTEVSNIDIQVSNKVGDMTVYVELTEEQKKRITENYTENMKLYIQEWTEKEIVKLREEVEVNVKTGIRSEHLAEQISKRYGVSKSKAKFLARQETRLLTTELQKERYLDAGVNKYIWKNVIGSPNHPVRPFHKNLNGSLQSWDNPPIINDKGDRKNPGQDYNCRCKAYPVLEF
jgi:SPP1 gp7 family putative phage head morphogenesis protein